MLRAKKQSTGPKHTESKKPRMNSCSDTSDYTDVAIESYLGHIRRQISKWQQTQTNEGLHNLMEHEHFDVMVGSTGVAHITCCMYTNKFQLGMKKEKFLISNWSRHVCKCVDKLSHSTTQRTLDFPQSSSSETPLSSSSALSEGQRTEEPQLPPFRDSPPVPTLRQEGNQDN